MKSKNTNRFEMIYIFISISLLMMYTTSSFSFMGLSLFGVVLLLIWTVLYIEKILTFDIRKVYINIVLLFVMLVFLLIRMNYQPGIYYKSGSDLKSFLYFFSYIYISIILYFRFRFCQDKLGSIVKSIIILNVAIFILQLILYKSLSYNLDISTLLGGDGNRTSKIGTDIYRGTGIFDEPSIYCGFVISLLCFLNIIYKTSKKFDFLVSITITLSLSFAGYFMLFIFIFFKYTKLSFKNILTLITVSTLLVIFIYNNDFLMDRILSLLSGGDSSTLYKYMYFDYWYSIPEYFYIGTGVSNDVYRPGFFDAAYDLTFFGASIGTYGVFASLILFFIILSQAIKSSFKNMVYLLIPLLKITILHTPIFVLFFLFLMLVSNREHYSSERI